MTDEQNRAIAATRSPGSGATEPLSLVRAEARNEHSNPIEAKPHYGLCAACGEAQPISGLSLVRPDLISLPEPLDLGDMMVSRGQWMCTDAAICQSRAGNVICAVIVPAETWAAGQIALITTDPRRAEENAAAYRGVTVHLGIHTDYRPERSRIRE